MTLGEQSLLYYFIAGGRQRGARENPLAAIFVEVANLTGNRTGRRLVNFRVSFTAIVFFDVLISRAVMFDTGK